MMSDSLRVYRVISEGWMDESPPSPYLPDGGGEPVPMNVSELVVAKSRSQAIWIACKGYGFESPIEFPKISIDIMDYASGEPRLVSDDPEFHKYWSYPARGLEKKNKFQELADGWFFDSAVHSSPELMKKSENYRRIVEMGQAAVPFILEIMGDNKSKMLWHIAMRDIVDAETVFDQPRFPAEIRGNVREMELVWLDWGDSYGF